MRTGKKSSNHPSYITLYELVIKLANSREFYHGYTDYRAGKPFAYDMNIGIPYERGRLFALYISQSLGPKAVWRKGVLAKTTQQILNNAFVLRRIL